MIEHLAPEDRGYPAALRDLEQPPALWWRGSLPAFERSVAIIGTRHPTPYGQRIARRLAEACARIEITVVSGLAIGIDAAAHLGALDAPGGRTVAVLASGVDLIHPSTNRALAERAIGAGCILSTYPPGTPVRKHRFLERNRIIAALCQALVVVEGVHPSSGALSTVLRAQELGREVLAVPGMVTTPQASVPNTLLRDGCAPCLDVRDVALAIESFRMGTRLPAAGGTLPGFSSLVRSTTGRRLLDALDGSALELTVLATAAGMSLADAMAELLELELAGFVRRTPQGLYETSHS